MPEKRTVKRAKRDLREGKSPSTAAGEFVKEEMEHIREGKHGARSPEQAIEPRSPSRKRSSAVIKALKREGKAAASRQALSRHAKTAERRRSR